jgi:hypothetical protein
MENQSSNVKVEKALLCYNKQMARIRKYNDVHREELNTKAKEYFKKIKEDPERYELYKEQKRKKYKELKSKQGLNLPVKEN